MIVQVIFWKLNREVKGMGYGIKLLVWGDRASFNRPEMKVERVTYDVMTPSAARGILEAIYWKPQMKWVIDRIHVLNPIRFSNIRRNELGGKIAVNMKNTSDGSEMGVLIAENRQQRAGIILLNVKYGIEAHIDVVEKDRTNEHSGAKYSIANSFRMELETVLTNCPECAKSDCKSCGEELKTVLTNWQPGYEK